MSVNLETSGLRADLIAKSFLNGNHRLEHIYDQNGVYGKDGGAHFYRADGKDSVTITVSDAASDMFRVEVSHDNGETVETHMRNAYTDGNKILSLPVRSRW